MRWIPLFASPTFLLSCLFALSLSSLLALFVPQGISDEALLSILRLDLAPFAVFFGLHRFGLSMALWFPLLGVVIHLIAVYLSRRNKGPEEAPRRVFYLAFLSLGLLALITLVFLAGKEEPQPQPETSRLRVRLKDEGNMEHLVDEGAVYEVPSTGYLRRLVFGSLPMALYAVEMTDHSDLKVHLSGEKAAQPGPIEVSPRRPRSPDEEAPKRLPRAASTALALIASYCLFVLVRRGEALPKAERRLAFIFATLSLASLWPAGAGLGLLGQVPLVSSSGEDATWRVLIATPSDPLPWNLTLLARAPIPWTEWPLLLFLCFCLVTSVFVAISPSTFLSRLASSCAFALGALNAFLWLLWTLVRIPVYKSASSLSDLFMQEILPKVPLPISVLSVSVPQQGPFFVPMGFGAVAFVATLVPVLWLWPLVRQKVIKSGPSQKTFEASLYLLLLCALFCAIFWTFFGHPEIKGASVFSLTALFVASFAPLAARLHKERPATPVAIATIGASMELALAFVT